MSTLDDKVMGEKLQYYCSSSEDDDTEQKVASEVAISRRITKASSHTGPKGVIEDARLYRQLEYEKSCAESDQLVNQAKRLTLSGRTEKSLSVEETDESGSYLLYDDAVLRQFIQRRMTEMSRNSFHCKQPRFCHVIDLTTSDQFLDAIDNEQENVTIVVHIYSNKEVSCVKLNSSLVELAHLYPIVKFCKIHVHTAGLSQKFVNMGLPAIVVYKGGSCIVSYVSLDENMCGDFSYGDVESFFIEKGLFPDSNGSYLPASYQSSSA